MKTFSINKTTLAALYIFAAAFLFSCQKENSTSQTVTEEQAVIYSEESSEAEGSLDDAEDVAIEQAAVDRIIQVFRRPGGANASVLLAGGDQFCEWQDCPSAYVGQ